MLLKNIRYVLTQDERRRVLEHVSIRIEHDRITQIGDLEPENGEEVLDCTDRAVLPGLINAHTHLGLGGFRGLSDDKELHAWLADVMDAEKRLTPEDIERESAAGMREALRTGTTTIVDMYYAPERVAAAARTTGIRTIVGATILPGHVLSQTDLALPQDESRITFAYAPHALYTTDEHVLRSIREQATRDGRRIMIHLSETRKERAEWKAKTGALPAEWLDRIGFLGPDVLAIHCVWLTKGELDLLAKHRVGIAHCPQSNMKLAGGGTMPLREMRERGLRVALGTDSVVSNNSLDLLREMHVCALLHKHHYWDSRIASAQDVLDMATICGAMALNIPDIGSITIGKKADLITLDLTDENLTGHSAERIVSHVVYAANGLNVADTIVDGVLLLHNKQFVMHR